MSKARRSSSLKLINIFHCDDSYKRKPTIFVFDSAASLQCNIYFFKMISLLESEVSHNTYFNMIIVIWFWTN